MSRIITPPRPTRPPTPDAERWLEALPAPVLGLDQGLRIRFVNAAAAELLAGGGLLGRRLDEVFGANSPLVTLVQRAFAADTRMAEADVPVSVRDTSLGRMAVAAAPVGDNGYLALVLTPIPRPRAQTPAGPHSAARTLAHEVRNPLAGIRAAAQLIGRAGDAETSELAQLICDEVDRVNRLTERIDPLGAMHASKFNEVNVHEALGRVRQLLRSSAPKVKLRERYDPSLPPLQGDLDQLIQAFLNIAKNAVEAVGDREDAEVTFVTAYRPGVRMKTGPSREARAQLEVQIIDNGPGFAPEVADHMFEAFATTKAGGMGLGLTVAAEVVARHGGHIEAESMPGRTVFHILLPIQPEGDNT
ncbi:MAG: ATP-binding protein [Hyphomonadaceae bacterium]|nr:ATP-binding protein [Hyphomonadaceae bacterium]